MKNFTFLFKISFLLIVFSLVTSQVNAKTIKTNQDSQTELQLLSSSEWNLIFSNKVGSINTEFVNMEGQDYVKLAVAAYTKSIVYGDPEMPVRRKLIEIPHGATPVVQIINYDIAKYNLADYGVANQILPLQFSVPKCGDAPEFICNNEIYQLDAFINQELVTVDVLGIMRGTNIARVNISPIFYNPVKNTIRVYENLEFEIVFEGADLALTQSQKEKYYSPYFNNLFGMLENYSMPASRDENLTRYPIKYVIVSDPQFEEQLQPFIEWKTRKGFTVVEAYTDVIGSTKPEIKAYIQDLYDAGTSEDPAPSFVLFVGDVGQIPAYENGNGETDRLYFEYTGDLFPEIFYGRFSAQNAVQLQPYIDKTLQYEQYTMPDPSYLEEVVMIAGMDSGHGYDWGNGQINYGTINYFNEDHDILSHTYLYPNSGSNAAQIRQDISNGVSFANYTAHCGPSGWGNPSFNTSHIPALQNQDKYGLLIGNCCSSSEFAGTCFAEEILRAENKGAVGYIGGSNSTYWDEDYYFGVGYGAINENPPPYEETGLGNYDRSFHDHGEVFGDWFTTMDQVVYAGNFAVSEGAPGSANYYWDIYNLMGDPSLMIYYGVPEEMPVTHSSTMKIGQDTLSVDAVPYAYISITMDNVIHGVALADENGHADLTFEAFLAPGEAEIIVTAQNYQPYIASIDIIPAEGPYIIYANHVVNDETGNNNGLIDCGESILLDFTIENVGVEEANVEVLLTIDNPYIVLIDSVENFGMVAAEGEVTIENAFSFTVANNIPDQTVLNFTMTATVVDREDFVSDFSDMANAPALEIVFISIDDEIGGNNNGRLDAGETVNLIYHAKNNGHVASSDAVMSFVSSSEYITVNTSSIELGVIDSAGYVETSFEIVTAEDAPIGVLANFSTDLVADAYTASFSMMLPIGLIVEDFETGDFTAFDWTFSGNADWEIIDGLDVYEGLYSAKSGAIGNNQSTALELIIDVPMDDVVSFYKKVSSESGYDELKFYIDGVEKGSWDGEVAWSFEEYEITEGEHTLKWEYEKDGSQIGGSDCAWVDFIVMPSSGLAPLFADFTSDVQNVYEIPDVNFYSNSIGNITEYTWTFEGGEPETSNEENPTISYNVPGVYSVSLTVSDGDNENTITKNDFITVHYWVGFEERETLKYKLYPNPSSGIFTLEVSANVSVEIRNTVGSLIYQNENVSAKETIDLSQKAKGLYFVTVRNDNQSFIEKIVISK